MADEVDLWDAVAAEEEAMVLVLMVAASLAMVEPTPLLHTLLATWDQNMHQEKKNYLW